MRISFPFFAPDAAPETDRRIKPGLEGEEARVAAPRRSFVRSLVWTRPRSRFLFRILDGEILTGFFFVFDAGRRGRGMVWSGSFLANGRAGVCCLFWSEARAGGGWITRMNNRLIRPFF